MLLRPFGVTIGAFPPPPPSPPHAAASTTSRNARKRTGARALIGLRSVRIARDRIRSRSGLSGTSASEFWELLVVPPRAARPAVGPRARARSWRAPAGAIRGRTPAAALAALPLECDRRILPSEASLSVVLSGRERRRPTYR